MKVLGWMSLIVAGVSFILGVISKVTLKPFYFLPGGLKADNFMDFTQICLLTAIAFILLAIANKK
ncbi:MAG: hypothetical protein B1H08_01740 [Candidatus Omnitrophica bacterium 4484_171]|nr:MAG: hypothetical protein B1H08_01740 [Candidatus Omnitrophica bacterium 4484_171]